MKDAINALTAHTFTPLSETLYEAEQYYAGRTVDFGNPASVAASRNPSNTTLYKTPIEYGCQKNFIVYLTDGEPTYDSDADAKIKALKDANGTAFSSLVSPTCDVETYPSGFSPSGGDCLDDLAEFMNKGDLSTLAGQQNITTYTIGFTVDLPILVADGTRGGGAVLHGQRHGGPRQCHVEHRDVDSADQHDVHGADRRSERVQPHADPE